MAEVTPDEVFVALDTFLTRLMAMAECGSIGNFVDTDLSFSQVRMLFLLAQLDEPVAITEVAARLGLSVAASGRNVERLVCQDLVLRREDPGDRRTKLVSLTEAGRVLVACHVEDKHETLRAFAGRLAEPDRRRLLDALQPILAGDALRARSQEL